MSIERYHCDRCHWDGEAPALADDPLGEFVFTLRVCPECGEEVSQTMILEGSPPSETSPYSYKRP